MPFSIFVFTSESWKCDIMLYSRFQLEIIPYPRNWFYVASNGFGEFTVNTTYQLHMHGFLFISYKTVLEKLKLIDIPETGWLVNHIDGLNVSMLLFIRLFIKLSSIFFFFYKIFTLCTTVKFLGIFWLPFSLIYIVSYYLPPAPSDTEN